MMGKGDLGWAGAFRAAGKWVGIASAVTVPVALLLPDPWSRSPIPMILWLVVGAVPVLVPVASGWYYGSVKTTFATVVLTLAMAFAVLVVLFVVNLGAGYGSFY